ncbi:MAG: tetratricopeptide repeat protein [Methylococcales bacterium]|nr:tetratricopeptide repeat protein [Methylococcales bacterium]
METEARIETKDTTEKMGQDEFLALQMMSYIFLQHRKYDKAGILLKTLHQLFPDHEKVRISLAFVLLEFELLDESEEMLSPLLNDDNEKTSAANLLYEKLSLTRRRLQAKAVEKQQSKSEGSSE